LICKLLHLLTPRERRRGALILLMVTGMAALEIAGVASVMPFLSVLGNPEVVRENDALAAAYHGLGFASVDAFLIAHRLSTVRECDQVVLLEKGQVTAAGGFEELPKQS